MLVGEAMTTHPTMLSPSATIGRAAAEMRENDIGDVLVVGRDGRLQGIVTDRDITVRAVAEGRKPSTKLKGVATSEVITVRSMDGAEEAAETMSQQGIRRLPVVDDDGKPIGIVSLGDLATRLDRDSALADISKAPPNR